MQRNTCGQSIELHKRTLVVDLFIANLHVSEVICIIILARCKGVTNVIGEYWS